MNSRSLVFVFFIPVISACSDSELTYGLNNSKISGTVSCGKREHPNGQNFEFCVVQLEHPVSIAAEKDNPFNPAETGVNEVQVFSTDNKIDKAIKEKQNTKITATGEVFHQNTAWHVRKLVMNVQEIK